MVSSSPLSHITHGIILDIKVSPVQHSLGVEPIYKDKPGKNFTCAGAPRLPDDFEGRVCIYVLEHLGIKQTNGNPSVCSIFIIWQIL
jgi:hypothetical protein